MIEVLRKVLTSRGGGHNCDTIRRAAGLSLIGDFVPGYEVSGTVGIGAPKGTPDEIVAALNREINAGLTDPKMKMRIAELGTAVRVGSPADFGKLIADETEKWSRVIKFAGIKQE
jgi:tripartite-type tricarboxylate transporter receptor subunit TctC